MSEANTSLTAVRGLRVGHWTDAEAQTGCTVVVCPPTGCTASGVALGSGPGSRELALLAPEKTVERIDAVVLAGGSAFGLAAATGVVTWLHEQGRGFETPFAKVPIVPAAVIYDLGQGSPTWPGHEAGYEAARAATEDRVASGRIGAGTGATVGKYLGFDRLAPGGLGNAARRVGEATVAALAVSNAAGDIVDLTGKFLAGARQNVKDGEVAGGFSVPEASNTTLVIVATDAVITKTQAYALSQSAHIGIARVTRPSHTVYDGDTTFVLSTGTGPEVPLIGLSVAVQEVVAEAIVDGVKAANGV